MKFESVPFVIFLILLVLKMCGLVTFSWLWVFAPLWIPAVGFLIVVFFLFFLATIAG